MSPELPDYSVRVSNRARRVRLTVNVRDGLVVVVPRGLRIDADRLVRDRREWAAKALARVAPERALIARGAEALLPDRVDLLATGEHLAVRYQEGEGPATVRRSGGALVVGGASSDPAARIRALQRWLHGEARVHLTARCEELAMTCGSHPSRIRIAAARTRWGSCSARGTVSLNRSLMLVPLELVDGLILHELAHLTHLDHSARFWDHLAALDPAYRGHRSALQAAQASIPLWARPDTL